MQRRAGASPSRVLKNSQERGYRGQSPLSGGLGSLPAVGGVSPQI